MTAEVLAIYTAPNAGEQLVSVETATLESGKGIIGDRYFNHAGTFSEKLIDSADWEITLIEFEEIQRYNESQQSSLSPGDFRRNIITSGMRLNDLEGHQFSVGGAILEGVRLCEPCAYLGSLLGSGIVKAMAHKAGLRARIIHGAVLRAGDAIAVSHAA